MKDRGEFFSGSCLPFSSNVADFPPRVRCDHLAEKAGLPPHVTWSRVADRNTPCLVGNSLPLLSVMSSYSDQKAGIIVYIYRSIGDINLPGSAKFCKKCWTLLTAIAKGVCKSSNDLSPDVFVGYRLNGNRFRALPEKIVLPAVMLN